MISNKMNRKYKNDSFLDNIFNKSTTDIQINNYFNLNISDNSILFLDSQNSKDASAIIAAWENEDLLADDLE